ncbi:MAG: flagellar export protein FliJ [Nitrospiria bacterium]
MKKYKTRLDAVLKVREYDLDVQRQLFNKSNHQLNESKTRLCHLETEAIKARKQFSEKQKFGMMPSDIALFHHFNQCQEEKMQTQKEIINTLSKEVEKKRRALESRFREIKAIEKIETTRKIRFDSASKKRESDLMDEISSYLQRYHA